MKSLYDKKFYERNKKNQKALAVKIVPFIAKRYCPNSVVDFGCGTGMFLKYFDDYDVNKYGNKLQLKGIDFHDFNDIMEINKFVYLKHDLSMPINLKHKFDLVISLEVAEHLPKSASKIHVDNLIRHARNRILFSAATPGQGGDGHINEQPHNYWHKLFEEYNYKPNDCIQKILKDNKNVPFWYRKNIFIYEKTF